MKRTEITLTELTLSQLLDALYTLNDEEELYERHPEIKIKHDEKRDQFCAHITVDAREDGQNVTD